MKTQITPDSPLYLTDHRAYKQVVVPGAAYVEVALAAGKNYLGTECLTLRNVMIQQALILPEENLCSVQTILTPLQEQSLSFEIHSQNQGSQNQGSQNQGNKADQDEWSLHVSGEIFLGENQTAPDRIVLAQLQERMQTQRPVSEHYEQCATAELPYGPHFQVIEQLWIGEGEALGKIGLPEPLMQEAQPYVLHPTILDGCFQVVYNAIEVGTYLPINFDRVDVFRAASDTIWCHVQVHNTQNQNGELYTLDLQLFNTDGEVVALFTGMSFKKAERSALLRTLNNPVAELGYDVLWVPKEQMLPTSESHQSISTNGASSPIQQSEVDSTASVWLIFTDEQGVGKQAGKTIRCE